MECLLCALLGDKHKKDYDRVPPLQELLFWWKKPTIPTQYDKHGGWACKCHGSPQEGVILPGGIWKGFGEDKPLESHSEGAWDFSRQKEGIRNHSEQSYDGSKGPGVYGMSEVGWLEQQEGDRGE